MSQPRYPPPADPSDRIDRPTPADGPDLTQMPFPARPPDLTQMPFRARPPDPSARLDRLDRLALVRLLDGIEPYDALEVSHQKQARAWVLSDAPVYRTAKPDVPDPHLVAYFVVFDETTFDLLLVDHRKAGRWLPPGGHVEPGEQPWHTVVRECEEELSVAAVPSTLAGDRPFFVSVNNTSPPGTHTDVSLWYVIALDSSAPISYDRDEFAGIRWVPVAQVPHEPPHSLDTHLPRFAAKLLGTREGSEPKPERVS